MNNESVTPIKENRSKKIKTMRDVKLFISELKEEIEYFGNRETIMAFEKILSEWNFNPEDFQSVEF